MERDVYARMDAQEQQHWWFAARREIIAALIQRHRPANIDRPRILEAGCGTGGNLRMLQAIGEVRAFEYDAVARQAAIDKTDLEVAAGALPDDLPFPNETFDVIGIFDVLEHVERDVESLSALKGQLADGGKIFVTVPAFPALWSAHDEKHHHFRRYTRASLTEAADKAGLRVSYISYYNFFLFPLAVAARAMKRLTGRKTPDDAMPGAFVNGILTRLFGIERHILVRGSLPFGLSLAAILEKN